MNPEMSLFDGRVGEDFTETRLNQLYEEGAVRYASLTPPGYMDLKEKKERGNRHLYGDVIVWFQTIEKQKSLIETLFSYLMIRRRIGTKRNIMERRPGQDMSYSKNLLSRLRVKES